MKKKIFLIIFLFFFIKINAQFEPKNWKCEGPDSKDLIYYNFVGRINEIEYNKKTDKILFGASTGGFWMCNLNGDSVLCTSDNIPGGVSSIAINPKDSNNILASFVFFANGVKKSFHYSYGLFESKDGGKSWNKTKLDIEPDYIINLNKIIFDKLDERKIFVLTDSFVFVTKNAGKKWSKLNLKPADNEVFIQMTQLDDGSLVVSGKNCIYFSNIKKNIWRNMVPDFLINDCKVMISSYQNTLFAAVYSTKETKNLFLITQNKGESWTIKRHNLSLKDFVSGIWAFNDSVIFTGGVSLFYTVDGGVSFNSVKGNIHPDVRDVLFIDEQDYKKICVATDGGLFYTENLGKSWILLSTESVYQAYSVACSQKDSCILFAGMHDNGTLMRNKSGQWKHILGGDGAGVAVSDDEKYQFAFITQTLKYRNFQNSWNSTGIITDLLGVNPAESKNFTDYFYAGGFSKELSKAVLYSFDAENNLKVELDFSWGLVTYIETVDAKREVVLYASASIWKKKYYSLKSVEVFEDTVISTSLIFNECEQNTLISGITERNNATEIWISFNSFEPDKKIWYSPDSGKNWTNISLNLPNVPVYAVYYCKYCDLLLIGNDYGVFYFDKNKWSKFGEGLPVVSVTDFDFCDKNKTLYISTYGRGIWSMNLQN